MSVMGRLVETIYPEKDAMMQSYTQSGNITTNLKVKVSFTLPVLSASNLLMWKFHVEDSSKVRYDTI